MRSRIKEIESLPSESSLPPFRIRATLKIGCTLGLYEGMFHGCMWGKPSRGVPAGWGGFLESEKR
jgi:hypothetical protein